MIEDLFLTRHASKPSRPCGTADIAALEAIHAELATVRRGSKGLDALISLAAHGERDVHFVEYLKPEGHGTHWSLMGWRRCNGDNIACPSYTTSLDAAVKLYPERPATMPTDPIAATREAISAILALHARPAPAP
jgi:hypothetical protein